ncbi:hypothetical protein [Leifsonia sp. LS-T14]|uniref:hypothetical protein n=1 Tax=unclassified Leifsonia TaxID=2663824 RepID=UPI0035A63B4A
MSLAHLGLGYRLPRTQFVIDLVRRTTVVTDDHGLSWPSPVVDVTIAPSTVEDPESQQVLLLDEGALEDLSLTIQLDDRGFITSVNSEAGRDLSPVIDLIGKAVGLAATIITTVGIIEGPLPPPRSLDEQWEDAHPRLAALRDALAAKCDQLFTALTTTDAPAELSAIGAALDVVQSQLASISEARRGWLAGRASPESAESLTIGSSELFPVDGRYLHPQLQGDPSWSVRGVDVAGEFGAIVALAQDAVPGADTAADITTGTDVLVLRRPRPAVVGVYLLHVDTKTHERTWRLDPGSERHIDIVDERSPLDHLSLNGKWLHKEKFELSYHPDMSLKTFGFSSTSSASAIATSTGGLMDAVAAARTSIAAVPSAEKRQLEAATTQLDLLKTASEFEVLSATRARAAEVAVLEQKAKLAAG